MNNRICPKCGVTFKPLTWTHKFCSEKCGRTPKKQREIITKKCKKCGGHFESKSKIHKYCSISCQSNDVKNVRDYYTEDLNRKSKIGESTYIELLEIQNGLCAICGSDNPQNKHHKRFSVDHDHKTGIIRGLVCDKCNSGLARFDDNIENLKRAIRYLESNKNEEVRE